MHNKLGTRRWRIAAGAMALTALLGACGDDDDDDDAGATTTTEAEDTTTTTAAGGEFAAYCDAVAEIDGEEAAPTVDQMEAIREAAPEQIAPEVDTLADAFIEAIESGDFDSLFNDTELQDEFAAVEAFEAENCDDGGEDAGGEVNPEFADYCAAVAETDEQESFPTVEQLEAIRAAAPDEISAEINVVVDAFVAAYESDEPIEDVFEDPAVSAALEPIEEFENENCGTTEEAVDRSAINPEFEQYCELAIEVFEQPSFPDAEQLEQLRTLAPDEIREAAETIVPIFLEAIESGGGFEEAFENPEVEPNLDAIEQFDSENCGIPLDG